MKLFSGSFLDIVLISNVFFKFGITNIHDMNIKKMQEKNGVTMLVCASKIGITFKQNEVFVTKNDTKVYLELSKASVIHILSSIGSF